MYLAKRSGVERCNPGIRLSITSATAFSHSVDDAHGAASAVEDYTQQQPASQYLLVSSTPPRRGAALAHPSRSRPRPRARREKPPRLRVKDCENAIKDARMNSQTESGLAK
ncbi:hypothetical protein TNCV_1201851 [Trichonephila clavipes]|nr:hypothetical protein TNCV_1201851 [Trichonephila clavipes]